MSIAIKPAHPVPIAVRPNGELEHSWDPGMTLREYFAAHAPVVIPDWFDGPFSMPPPMPQCSSLPEHLQEQARQWLLDPCFDLTEEEHGPELAEFQRRVGAAEDARQEWKADQAAQRYFAWRVYYANALAAELEGNVSGGRAREDAA